MQWEVAFDIRPLFRERENHGDGDTDLWSETFHHLAAKSVIRDLEQLAEKECEIEHGNTQLLASLQAGCRQTLGVGFPAASAASPVSTRAASGEMSHVVPKLQPLPLPSTFLLLLQPCCTLTCSSSCSCPSASPLG